jgi:hypothetical protein
MARRTEPSLFPQAADVAEFPPWESVLGHEITVVIALRANAIDPCRKRP